ncbi:MAG TPA: hypothetical protein VNA19_04695 [Pyrinomonadaceae bacterium]|jgi:hypothetical protein|nr:hypothetical protein [Pyrinomonadaceae bacterium]
MIENDEQLEAAQRAVHNLQRVLLIARRTHGAEDYRLMATPFLLELQQREHEILNYLAQPHISESDVKTIARP